MKDTYTIIYECKEANDKYVIKINTHLGMFTGETQPDEEDVLYPSVYHASEIALAKALEKYAKAAIHILQLEVQILKNIVKQINDNKRSKENYSNTAFRTVWGTLKQKEKELKRWELRKTNIINTLQKRIEARERIVAAYKKKDKAE